MDHESITFTSPEGEQTIRARTRIWAAGVQASALATQLAEKSDAETDRAGRIPVQPDCTVPGHPEVFANIRSTGALSDEDESTLKSALDRVRGCERVLSHHHGDGLTDVTDFVRGQ